MIVGIGTDLCEIDRMKKLLQDERFLDRYFADEEKVYIKDRGRVAPASMAGIFAAKEALVKALGTGFLNTELKEICVLHDHLGKPYLELRGEMAMHVSQ
ncbi:MAG: 4-phosphopantetheinyl transferase, partial [Clostridiales bacterium]|nr:4-phosphopantetheinyl transferase [Clostridiales bacterium]